MVVFHVSTFILQLHTAGGYDCPENRLPGMPPRVRLGRFCRGSFSFPAVYKEGVFWYTVKRETGTIRQGPERLRR